MQQTAVVLGSFNYDIFFQTDRLPAVGESLPAADATWSAGGKGANQAVQLAKLGIETHMLGCVGTDAMGAYLLSTAQGHGVCTDHVRRVEGAIGLSVSFHFPGGNVCGCACKGANAHVSAHDVDRALPLLQKAGLLVLQMEIPLETVAYAIDQAHACGCPVLLNAAPALDFPLESFHKCSVLVFNEVKASHYLGENIDSLQAAQERIAPFARHMQADCVFTLGKLGCVVCSDGQVQCIPALPVQAVETTGAGDSFIGGLGYSLLHGQDLFAACAFATRCSALTIGAVGAQNAMPTLAQVEQRGTGA